MKVIQKCKQDSYLLFEALKHENTVEPHFSGIFCLQDFFRYCEGFRKVACLLGNVCLFLSEKNLLFIHQVTYISELGLGKNIF